MNIFQLYLFSVDCLNFKIITLLILIPFLCLPALFSSPQAWGPSLEPQATAALCRTKEAATGWLARGCTWTPTGSLENLSTPTVTLVWWTESPLVPRPSRASTRTPGTDTCRKLAHKLLACLSTLTRSFLGGQYVKTSQIP